MGIRRPPAAGDVSQQMPATDQSLRPELQVGAVGAAVSELQQMLGIAVDGEFGPDTDKAVRAFQVSHGLDVDGVVATDTWSALLGRTPMRAVQAAATSLAPALIGQITALARSSALARISWRERGVAPVGYINGVAVTFARVYLKLKAGDSAALAMTAPIGGPRTDALAWFGFPGGDRPALLRQLFVLLYGLGMRESSGNCFEGRDQSANNVTADTAEAGLFQQSWDSRSASPELPKLLAAYSANPDGSADLP
jgi:peptidoglycan hydrolase-like protein with peptidoglycan-binding domain